MKNALQVLSKCIPKWFSDVFWWIGPQFEALTLRIYLFLAIARLAAWIRGVLWIDRSHFHPPKIFPDLQTMDHLDKHVELHMDWIHFHSKTWAQNVLQVTLRWFTVKLFCSIITELSKISAKNFYLHFQQFLFLETNWLSFNWQSPHFTWWIISAQVTGMSVTVRCIYQQQLITELLLLSFCHQTAQPFLDLIVNAPF